MSIKVKKVVVFDLDDTIYNEIDYLKSAFTEISNIISTYINISNIILFNDMLQYYQTGQNSFEEIIKKYNLSISITDLLKLYRNHIPTIIASPDRLYVFNYLKTANIPMCVLTDGRSVQQKNKISALGIKDYFDSILISEEFGTEKPHLNNFKHFENIYGTAKYFYIGDNIKKDFITPNKLNWTTICLKDNGLNIHKQNSKLITHNMYLAKHTVNTFSQIIDFVK